MICEHCHLPKLTIPNRGRRLCGDCSWAEMQDSLKHEGFRCIENGREVVAGGRGPNGLGYVVPRKAR